ncbi:MAG: pilus assembly protein PilM [Acidobacteria bacterium]|nr:pilus assembly protein PilM [Acidobacteriota bacterium]
MTTPSLLASAWPTVAVEIAPRRVTAVAVSRRGRGTTVLRHATEVLPEGAVTANLTAANIVSRGVVIEALKRVFDQLGTRPTGIGLVVPDTIAKVSLIRFDKAPPRHDDLEQLVRWQVRKTAPFRIEDAQVTFTPGAVFPDGGHEFVVALARRDVVQEYEAVCAAAGTHAGVVDLASFNLINLVLATEKGERPETDWLLVNVTPDYATIALVRGHNLVFFRNRHTEGDEDLAEMVHQTAMYYEDRLAGAGFARVILAGAAASGGAWPLGHAEQIRRTLESRLATRVDAIDPRPAAALRDRIGAAPDLLDALASPVGLLVREAA